MIKAVPASSIFNANGDDDSAFGGISLLKVDFADVDFISSSDLRNMVVWIHRVTGKFPRLAIEFANVAAQAYRQLYLLKKVIPQAVTVSSLYVPFFCDPCSEDVTKLYQSSHLRSAPQLKSALQPFPVCPSCKNEMQLGAEQADYFELIR